MSRAKPKVFLCHASPDKPTVRMIYHFLAKEDFEPWLDEVSLVGGQDFKSAIEQAIKRSDYFLACLSQSAVDRRGFFQREVKLALEVLDEMPEDFVYLIPVRLEPCRVPNRLSSNQWIDYYRPDFEERLLRALSYDKAPITQIQHDLIGVSDDERYLASTGSPPTLVADTFLEARIVVDYSKLIEMLKEGDWGQAAWETLEICVLVSGGHTYSWYLGDGTHWTGLDSGDHIPCIHLRKLADLWAQSKEQCILPVRRKAEHESTFGSQIEYINRRFQECGLPPLMIFGRWGEKEKEVIRGW